MTTMKPQGKTDILVRDLGDEYLLYDVDGRTLHILNATAHRIWLLCDGQHSEEEMASELEATFSQTGSRTALMQDITGTIQEFAEKGLLSSNGQG